MIHLNRWWEYDKKEIMSYVYWMKDQIPPMDKDSYEESWEKVKSILTEQHGGEK